MNLSLVTTEMARLVPVQGASKAILQAYSNVRRENTAVQQRSNGAKVFKGIGLGSMPERRRVNSV